MPRPRAEAASPARRRHRASGRPANRSHRRRRQARPRPLRRARVAEVREGGDALARALHDRVLADSQALRTDRRATGERRHHRAIGIEPRDRTARHGVPIGAMDTGTSGAVAGGSARTPVQRGVLSLPGCRRRGCRACPQLRDHGRASSARSCSARRCRCRSTESRRVRSACVKVASRAARCLSHFARSALVILRITRAPEATCIRMCSSFARRTSAARSCTLPTLGV